MTRLDVLGELQIDPHGPLAEGDGGAEDLWSLLFAYGQIFWPLEGRASWFSGLDAQLRDASTTDGPLAIVETADPSGDIPLTTLVLSVTQVLGLCGRLKTSGLEVTTQVPDDGPSWQPRSWIGNLARRTDSGEGIRMSLNCPESAGPDALPPAGKLGPRIEELLALGGRELRCSAEASPSGVDLLVREMRWAELQAAHLIDLSILSLHAAGFRGAVTVSVQPLSARGAAGRPR